ncbi:MAG: MOSC domain-containing protein [Anaerolineales bacterium]|nr:MOSC domain-containing protein [Chloroflexota bacterium]MBL6981659.1 MOSC domain-containing protein [Anaerolineales bacterium]
MAHIFQINISDGGVPKLPITQAEVSALGVKGDRQRNTKHHGGPDRALCLFSLEHILGLQAEGNPIFPGASGENITIQGLDWPTLLPGDQFQLGDEVIIELTSHTVPCHNLEPYFQEGKFSRISQKTHPGWARFYARVLQPGSIGIGDRVTKLKEKENV